MTTGDLPGAAARFVEKEFGEGIIARVTVCVSGEVMNQIGVKLKNQSPFRHTIMISHCNGASRYIPTDDAYPKRRLRGNINQDKVRCGKSYN